MREPAFFRPNDLTGIVRRRRRCSAALTEPKAQGEAMRKFLMLALLASFAGSIALESISWASINLNSSRSNIYRLIYSADVMSQAQATAMLAELDKIGPANEGRLKLWLPANFRKHGVQGDKVKSIVILPVDKTHKQISIILLTNAADEGQARLIAVSDSGVVSNPTPVIIHKK
jgi:hypothetical protein